MRNKNARKYSDQLITIDQISEELVLIEESDFDYITRSGKVYAKYSETEYYLKHPHVNKHNGYVYVSIHTPQGYCTRRLHRLVAKAFIPNPHNYDIVMHLDNDKTNYNVSNLRWGTASENTQQAVDDGLLVNDKGFEDSQSKPVDVYSIYTGACCKHCGSISEAS